MNYEQKLNEICEKHRIPACHSDFQIENFIIGKETSLVGKHWQCLRELQARRESLKLINYEIEETQDNIELATLDLEKYNSKIKIYDKTEYKFKKLQIYIKKQERKIKKLNDGMSGLLLKKQDIEKEIKVFLEVFESITKDQEFFEFNNKQAQLEYWNRKFDTEVNMCQILNMPVSGELIKSIMALPEISIIRKKMLDALTNVNKKLLQQSN